MSGGQLGGATRALAATTSAYQAALGYGPTFGLVEVDRSTFARTPKPSAQWYGEIAKANALP